MAEREAAVTRQDDGSASRSFEDFYVREFDGQFRRARFMLGSAAAAEDIVHQGFVEVWKRWGSLEDPGPYLNRCVLNNARSSHRAAARTRTFLERSSRHVGAMSGEIEILDDLLSELPFNQRAVIVLRYYGGLRDVDIAAAMDCPVGSVGPWANRALRNLRRKLS